MSGSRGTQFDDPADALAFRAAREACRRHASDLYLASAFLPRAKRDAACSVFAFGRMIRDAIRADDGEPASSAHRLRHQPLHAGACCSSHPLDQRVTMFRDRLDDLYEGRLELPSPRGRSEEQHVLHAFAAAVRRYQIPRQCFLDLAEGHRTDLSVTRYATWTALDRYLRNSGGAAALVAGCVFGVTSSDAAEFAVKAGKAVRLTAVLCDLKQDVERGTVYFPLEDLASFRYSERELLAGVVNDNFRRLMRFEVGRARRLYREAADGLCRVAPDGSRGTAATLLTWQCGLLERIERQGYDVFSRRPVLDTAQRLRLLPLARRLARRTPDQRVLASFTEGARLASTT